MAKRKITEAYLQEFVKAIQNGGEVTYVQKDNLLAVAHASQGWLIVQLKDKVVDEE